MPDGPGQRGFTTVEFLDRAITGSDFGQDAAA
jgi:hypothetical protein